MAKKKAEGGSLGQRMKEGRLKLGMSLEELAHESGYTLDVLKDVEEARIVPPVSLILQLNRILKLDMEEGEGASKKSTTGHKKRVASYAYQSLTKPGVDKHLRAYHVTIEAKTKHKGVEYHHDGEEFVYVLKGGLVIQVGENVSTLAKGDCLHFNSALHHKLNNPTSETAQLLVVIYVP
jgi:mannose-6-phosphate isomerase-like protein (cupin superfamily)